MSYSDMDIESSGDFLKLKAGETVTFHILTRVPEKNVIHWVDKKKINCIGKDCDICASGNKKKARWTISVWDRKSETVKKLEFGTAIANQIKAIAEMLEETGKTVHDTDLRIKTMGTSLETEYTVLPVPLGASIPEDVLEKFKDLPF